MFIKDAKGYLINCNHIQKVWFNKQGSHFYAIAETQEKNITLFETESQIEMRKYIKETEKKLCANKE